MSDTARTGSGLTRRELLKRGVALGGALAWVTPAVQLVGMQRALAAHVSDTCFCIKWDKASGVISEVTGSTGECIKPGTDECPEGVAPPPPLDGEFFVTDNGDGTYTVTYPENCTLVAIAIKCGGGSVGAIECSVPPCHCYVDLTPDPDSPSGGNNFYTVADADCPPNDQGQITSVSHIEFCFEC